MSTKEHQIDLSHLGKFQIFQGLSSQQIRPFAEQFRIFEISQNEMILKEGDPGDSLFLLLKGEVEVTQALTLKMVRKPETDSREKAIIRLNDEMYPFFGEMSIFSEDDTRTATIRSVTDCKLAEIRREDFFAVTREQPEIGVIAIENIARVLVERLKKTNNDVIKLTTALALILEK